MINSFRGKYFFLSNFYVRPIIYDGILYLNNEAAFQAQKCENYEDRKIFSLLNPKEAKKLGRHIDLRKDWEDIKINIMKEIVLTKFEQHHDLAMKLIKTEDEELVEENTWDDKIWGQVNGVGQNLLGKILMETRDILKNKNNCINLLEEGNGYFI